MQAEQTAAERAEELRAINEARKQRSTQMMVPLLYAPLLPLVRLGLRRNPPLRNAAFATCLAVALGHAGYIMFADSSV